jgi:hypothetical protein
MAVRGVPGKYTVSTHSADSAALFGVRSAVPLTYIKLSVAEKKFLEEMDAHKRGCTASKKHSLSYKYTSGTKVK